MSDGDFMEFVVKDPAQLAVADLLLKALDLAIRHDLRPHDGEHANQTSYRAREEVAKGLVAWAIGDVGVNLRQGWRQ